jgi:hypothetical protein
VHARKRRVESFEKREKDVKRGKNKEKSMCNGIERKKKYEIMKERLKKKKKEEGWQDRYERDESSERKIKVQGRMSRC